MKKKTSYLLFTSTPQAAKGWRTKRMGQMICAKLVLLLVVVLLFQRCEYQALHQLIDVSFEIIIEEHSVTFLPNEGLQGDFYWEFGDGQTSQQKEPTHTYQLSGEYQVKLRLVTAEGAGVFTKTIRLGGVRDIDGNVYRTVQVDSLIWMAENLRTTRCNDASAIKQLPLGESDLGSVGMYWHENDPRSERSIAYGPVYNWTAVSACNVCPAGWWAATDSEWDRLIRRWHHQFESGADGLTYAAYQLREQGNEYWGGNSDATNSTGFSARPGGWLFYQDAGFMWLEKRTAWWNIGDQKDPLFTKIADGPNGTWIGNASPYENFYVRCVKRAN
ncbi:MAG: FISUMP domain-containing protein [Bacteroidota bacterium]